MLDTEGLLPDLPAGFWLTSILECSTSEFSQSYSPGGTFSPHIQWKRQRRPIAGEPPHCKSPWFGCSKEPAADPTTSVALSPLWERCFCPTPHTRNGEASWALWPITGITRAEQQLMLSSSQIRKALTWKCCWNPLLSLPRQARPSGRSQASLGVHPSKRFLAFPPHLFLCFICTSVHYPLTAKLFYALCLCILP